MDNQQREAQMELTRREMYRKSMDTIRVFNPLEHKFVFYYDSRPFSVPPKGTKDFPRYLTNLYFKKIADYMIGQQQIAQGDELKKLREQQLGRSYLDHYEENIEIWDKTPKLDDPDLLKVIRDTVILGLVEEYGYEEDLQAPTETRKVDFRSLHDQLLDNVDKKVSPEVSTAPLKPVKKKLAEEVTVNE